MRRIRILVPVLVLIFVVLRVVQTSSQERVVSWEKAAEYLGRTIVVEGVIVRSHNSGKACFLNFHPDYRQYLSLVIFASDFNRFPPQPERYYLNKKVRVRGRVLLYQGRPEIILNSPEQIRVIGEEGQTGIAAGEKPFQREGKEPESEEQAVSSQKAGLAANKQTRPGSGAGAQAGISAGGQTGSRTFKEISWEEAADYIGQVVRVRGKVVAASNTGQACFLNFHRNWKRYFTAVIFASAFDRFPGPPEKIYLNREVLVFGLVREYQGKPEIIVDSPEQVEIIR